MQGLPMLPKSLLWQNFAAKGQSIGTGLDEDKRAEGGSLVEIGKIAFGGLLQRRGQRH